MGHFKQGGQVMPVALGVLLLGAVGLVVLYNHGTRVSQKAVTTNAADAAAYSAGVWTARHLNFMAYTNRAMVANHVATGHLISYVGWMRYVEQAATYVARVTSFIPGVGQVAEMVRQLADGISTSAEEGATLLVPLSQVNNNLLHAAQFAAWTALRPGRIATIMQDVGRAHDPAMRINDGTAAGRMPGAARGYIQAGILQQRAGVISFVRNYSPSSDDNEISGFAGRSMGSSTRWITNRNGVNIWPVYRKRGGSRQVVSGGELTDWQSSDQGQTWNWKRMNWRTVVKGSATATEFQDGYQGVPGYFNVSNRDRDTHGLRMFAFASLPGTSAPQKDFMAVTRRTEGLSAIAEAEVYYRTPGVFTDDNRQHYNQLYNPYWDVRMVSGGLPAF